MSILRHITKDDVTRILLVVLTLCTLASCFYTSVPIYDTPTLTVRAAQIPEHKLSITNSTWIPSERILLANLTPKLNDPSWESSEWRQREYNARIETENGSSILYFNNQTAVNETYTWPEYAGWNLIWPIGVLNYTELTAEWNIRVLRGNITVDSLFRIGRGYSSQDIRGVYVTNSSSEMSASAGEEFTLVSTASNITSQFSAIEIGVLWIDLDILAAQGSIVAIDYVEV